MWLGGGGILVGSGGNCGSDYGVGGNDSLKKKEKGGKRDGGLVGWAVVVLGLLVDEVVAVGAS